MSSSKIGVHFAPHLVISIGKDNLPVWAASLRDWHHNGDPYYDFGRNVSNAKGVGETYAWHLHLAPASEAELLKWEKKTESFHRTSDRIIVYSMSKEHPLKYGILLLEFLDPNGHAKLKSGPSAEWERLAELHQRTGTLPIGSHTES